MRFRRGETQVTYREDSFGGNPVGNIMIDHCSCEWGLDENISFYRHMFDMHDGKPNRKEPTVNVTIQNTISAKALDTYGTTLSAPPSVVRTPLSCATSGLTTLDVTPVSVGAVCSTT